MERVDTSHFYIKDLKCCTVVAVQYAFGISFEEAQKFMREECGREKNKAVHFDEVFPESSLGEQCQKMVYKGNKRNNKYHTKPRRRVTLGKFVDTHPEGRYIVLVRGHAIAIVNGIVYDHSDKPRRQIKYVYKVGE